MREGEAEEVDRVGPKPQSRRPRERVNLPSHLNFLEELEFYVEKKVSRGVGD